MSKPRKPKTAPSRLRDIEIELTAYCNAESDRAPLMDMLKMFYTAAVKSQIGLAKALNTETEEEELILVGIQRNSWGTDTKYPIARLFNVDELGKYQFPDGKGGYVENAT